MSSGSGGGGGATADGGDGGEVLEESGVSFRNAVLPVSKCKRQARVPMSATFDSPMLLRTKDKSSMLITTKNLYSYANIAASTLIVSYDSLLNIIFLDPHMLHSTKTSE